MFITRCEGERGDAGEKKRVGKEGKERGKNTRTTSGEQVRSPDRTWERKKKGGGREEESRPARNDGTTGEGAFKKKKKGGGGR